MHGFTELPNFVSPREAGKLSPSSPDKSGLPLPQSQLAMASAGQNGTILRNPLFFLSLLDEFPWLSLSWA